MQTVVRVRQEGPNVLLVIGDQGTEMPWHAALELGRALIVKGHLAEEVAKHEAVIEDQAIVTRAGLPIGLVVDPRIKSEAIKEAESNTKLRRYMPGGVKASGWVGAPTVRRMEKKEENDATNQAK